MNSGGAGDWRSRGNREAIPQPINQARPVAGSIIMLAGLTSLWTRPRMCSCLRAPREGSFPIPRVFPAVDRAARLLDPRGGDRSSLVLRELKGPNCPRRIQLSPQGELVLHYPDSLGSRLLRSGRFYENRAPMRSRTRSLTATRKDKVTIAMEGVESIVR